jgi:hypothetical protein
MARRPGKILLGGIAKDPWSIADREWFAAHEGRTWRLREPLEGEIEDLLDRCQSIQGGSQAAIHFNTAFQTRRDVTSMWLFVVQAEPGKRMRVPVFKNGDKVDVSDPRGGVRWRTITQEDFTQVLLKQWTSTEWADLDHCVECGQPFRHGAVCFHIPLGYLCDTCGSTLAPGSFNGVSIYFQEGQPERHKLKGRVRRRLERSEAFIRELHRQGLV